ncbi:MAG: ferrochelatase, partial [Thermoguttaceae bacterium]|nr:ferrochelatase [Thermoguttaceae bacterium]
MFQAILLASYGGPEKIEDVEPFLNNIFSTTNIPAARQEAVFSRYRRFNGISPLPKECRNFCANLKAAAERRNQQLRIY